jgi:hypothetical protein
MRNAWVEFVRQYAKENNLSYGCAISEASPAYRKMKQEAKTPKTPTKKRITIKPKNEKLKADARESVENALGYLEKMKKKEDDKLEQSDFSNTSIWRGLTCLMIYPGVINIKK